MDVYVQFVSHPLKTKTPDLVLLLHVGGGGASKEQPCERPDRQIGAPIELEAGTHAA